MSVLLNAGSIWRNRSEIILVCLLVKFCGWELLRFGTAGWAWPIRRKIVTHGSSSSYDFGCNGTPVSERSSFSLAWRWCCLRHLQAGQQNLLLLRLYWFQRKLQLFSVFVSAPLQSVALDVVLLLYSETCHFLAQRDIQLVFYLKFAFLIGLGCWCGNASQLWKIPWLIFSLHNPSQPGM